MVLYFNCFGFNSAKFDLGVLIPFISGYAGLHEIEIKVLKKGAKYICLKKEDLVCISRHNLLKSRASKFGQHCICCILNSLSDMFEITILATENGNF